MAIPYVSRKGKQTVTPRTCIKRSSKYYYATIRARDLFLVAGCAATGALFLALGTLIADLLLAYTDPRVGSGERA